MGLLFCAEQGCGQAWSLDSMSGEKFHFSDSQHQLDIFAGGRMLISGRVAISSVCPVQSAGENILLCPLHLSSVMKACTGLVIPICFVWALQGLIKCLCICFERLVWKAMQNCYTLILPLIPIFVPWCAEFNHWGLIDLKGNTCACQMAKQHPSVMSSNLGLCGLQNTILQLPKAFPPSTFPQ